MVKVNFSSLNNNQYLLPEDIYLAEIIKVLLKPTKNKNGNYLCWILNIIDPDELSNNKLFLITSLKDTALWKLKKLLKTIDYPAHGDVVDIDPKAMIGRRLKVKVIQESYQGKLYNKIIDFEHVD